MLLHNIMPNFDYKETVLYFHSNGQPLSKLNKV